MLFLLGYTIPWIVAGVVLGALTVTIGSIARVAGLPAVGLAILLILLWQATPLKQRCLNLCHSQPPLAPFGLRAEIDVFEYGLSHGLWCVGTCWLLMLLPLLGEGSLHWAAMVLMMLVSIKERSGAMRPARWAAALPGWPGNAAARNVRLVSSAVQWLPSYDTDSIHSPVLVRPADDKC